MMQVAVIIEALKQKGFELVECETAGSPLCSPFCCIRDAYPTFLIMVLIDSIVEEFDELGVTRFAVSVEPYNEVAGAVILDLFGY